MNLAIDKYGIIVIINRFDKEGISTSGGFHPLGEFVPFCFRNCYRFIYSKRIGESSLSEKRNSSNTTSYMPLTGIL